MKNLVQHRYPPPADCPLPLHHPFVALNLACVCWSCPPQMLATKADDGLIAAPPLKGPPSTINYQDPNYQDCEEGQRRRVGGILSDQAGHVTSGGVVVTPSPSTRFDRAFKDGIHEARGVCV